MTGAFGEHPPASARHDTNAATCSSSTVSSEGRQDMMVADTAATSSGSGPAVGVLGRWSRAMTDSSDSCVDGGENGFEEAYNRMGSGRNARSGIG